MYNYNNPFMDMMRSFNENNMFNKNMNINNLSTICRRNAETVTAAAQMMTEGMQAIMRRQTEIMQYSAEIIHNNANNVFQASKDGINTNNLENNMNRSSDYSKNMLSEVMSGFKEMSDIMDKSKNEILDLLIKTVSDNVADMNETGKSNVKAAAENMNKKKAA